MGTGWIPRLLILRNYLKRIQPDIVHGFRTLEGYCLFAVFSGYPHLLTLEEFLVGIPAANWFKPWMRFARVLENLTLRSAGNIMTISDHVRRQLEGKTHAKLFDIPNIAAEAFFNVQKSEVRKRILYVGRISEEKGLMDLLKAVAMAQQQLQGFELDVVGGESGYDAQRYFSRCQEFALTNITSLPVRFLGWLPTDAIAELHRSAFAFVMPSRARYETFGVVLAEGLAAGTPAIVYNLAPMCDFIKNGITGFVIPDNEPRALSACLLALAQDQETWRTMSQNARREANRFRGTIVADRIVEAYSSILETSRRRRA